MRWSIVVHKICCFLASKRIIKSKMSEEVCVCKRAFAVASPKEGSDEGSVKLHVAGAFQKGTTGMAF